jgi:nucleotide-binding universal stress UspA family protein
VRVLAATDGSADATAAVEWARRLPLPADTHFLAVSVVSAPVLPNLPDWQTAARQAEVHAAHEAVDAACAKLGAAVEGRVVEGDDPRQTLIALATAWGADLVVLGARGLGAVKEFLLGSVSLGVTRHAPCPVLVCKGTPRAFHTVTVAHDGSDGARAARAFVHALPWPAQTHWRLLGVAERTHYVAPGPGMLAHTVRAAMERLDDERRRALEGALAPEAAELGRGGVTLDVSLSVGSPAAEILRYADVTGTDLLVVGARGLGRMAALLLGSVSEALVRHAACPVLVVRPRA